MTFSRGAVRSSEQLANIRQTAIDALTKVYDEVSSDDDRLAAFRSMMEATRLPSAASSDDLLLQIVKDADNIVRFALGRQSSMSFEVRQVVEHDFFWLYRHTPSWATPEQIAKGVERLRQSIRTFRDAINGDAEFVVHKTLVGFQSVFPPDWERDEVVGPLSHPYREA